MRRALVLVTAAALGACDFEGAFEAYCAETGRCADAGLISDAGPSGDAGTDAGMDDAGADAGSVDAGTPDAGLDAGVDAGFDAGLDAGPTLAQLANQGDGGVMPGCAFNRFNVGGFTSGDVNDCTAVTIQALKPEDAGGGGDVFCALPMWFVASPSPGLDAFADSSCTQAPTAGDMSAVFPTRFGTYRWVAGVTTDGFTISTSLRTFTAKATLFVDAGLPPLVVGECNLIEVSAWGLDLPAPAAVPTNPTVMLRQGGTGLTNCGSPGFATNDSSFFLGVRPGNTTPVTISVGGVVFNNTLSLTVPACRAAGASCSTNGECCSAACSSMSCQ